MTILIICIFIEEFFINAYNSKEEGENMSIDKLTLKNISVFEELNIEFSKDVNVLIGENGTGKTHLLKILYTISQERNNLFELSNDKFKYIPEEVGLEEQDVIEKLEKSKIDLQAILVRGSYLLEYFSSNDNDYANLVRNKGKKDVISTVDIGERELIENKICLELESIKYQISFHSKNIVSIYNVNSPGKKNKEDFVFIPAKEILSHSKGFTSIYNYREISFDKTYYDIIINSQKGFLKNLDLVMSDCLDKISKIIGGKVELIGEQFYIRKDNNLSIDFDFEAEGIRKLGLLWVLIRNGSIKKGSVLFWDEPEANANPKIIKPIVDILVQLSKIGVQIFITTHNYFVIQEFSLYSEYNAKKENVDINFISLYKNNHGGVSYEKSKTISELQHNTIVDEFNNLYNREQELFYDN